MEIKLLEAGKRKFFLFLVRKKVLMLGEVDLALVRATTRTVVGCAA